MTSPKDGELLRIYLGELDKVDGRPRYELIVREAHRQGLAGATVLSGVLGFGAGSRMHAAKILELSSDLPVVVEIVDTPEHLAAFLPWLEAHLGNEALATLEKVRILSGGRPPPA